MILGIYDNKGKMKKGVPMLIAILGITGALSIWGISEVWAQTKETHTSMKSSIKDLEKSDTAIINDISNRLSGIQTTLATTGISPEAVTAIVTTMKDANKEVVTIQLESQARLFDQKLDQINQNSVKETKIIKERQADLQKKATEVINRFDSSVLQQQQQVQRVEELATQVKDFNHKQEQINIRNARQNAETSEKLNEVLRAIKALSALPATQEQ